MVPLKFQAPYLSFTRPLYSHYSTSFLFLSKKGKVENDIETVLAANA